MEKITNSKILLVTNNICNNNCIICFTSHWKEEYEFIRDTKLLKKEMIIFRRLGFKRIEFTGGEPTLHPDIINLVKFAHLLKYKEISMNIDGKGVRISTEFLSEENIIVATVICKYNYKELPQIAEFFRKFKIKKWRIFNIFYLNTLSKFVDFFINITFLDFPHYIFSEDIIKSRRTCFHNNQRVLQIGYGNQNILVNKWKQSLKKSLPVCKNCRFRTLCGEILKQEIEPEEI